MTTPSFAQLVRRSLPVLMFALALGAASAQTATNTCGYTAGNDYSVSAAPDCVWQTFNKPAAFTAALTASGCSGGNYDDAWGWFTAVSTSTTITFDPNANVRPIMHVYTGVCGSLNQVDCVNGGSNGSNAVLNLTTVIGQNYMIRIQRHNDNAVMDGRLCISSSKSSDVCSLWGWGEYPVGTQCDPQAFNKPTAFTASMNPGGCNSGNFDDAWGWFTATSTTTIISFDPSASHRPVLHIFTGTCASLTQVACVDGGSNGSNADLLLNTTVGTKYLFRVQRQGTSDEMNGEICIWSPNSSDVCGFDLGNEFSVSDACNFRTFQKPALYTTSMNPASCNSGNFADAWGWFTATASTSIITYDPDDAFRPILHVFTGTCGSLTVVACNDGGSAGANAELLLNTVIGQKYAFRIQRQGSSAAMDGRVCIWTPNTSDICGYSAESRFDVSTTCSFQTFQKPEAFTATMNPGSCGSGNFDDAWGWFTATATTTVITFDPDASVRPIIHVFTGSCGSLTQLACHDGGGNGNNAEVSVATVVGQNYAFRVQRQGSSAAMDGRVCIWSPNTTDMCSFSPQNEFNVTTDCVFQSFDFPTAYASSVSPGGCSSGSFDDAWGWFTAASATTVITFDPDLNHRPIIHVFSGTCGSLVQLSCVLSGGNGTNAEVVVNTVIGQNYIFRIQQYNASQGMNGRVCFRIPPGFDACSQSQELPVLENAYMQTFSNAEATRSPETPNPICGGTISDATLKDVWFHFVAPASGVVVIETTAGSINNVVMQLYSGTCGSLTLVECNDTGMGGNMPKIDRRCNPLMPNATYRLRVWGRNGIQGSFNISVRGFDVFLTPQEDCAGNNAVCNDQVIRNSTDWRGCTADLGTSNRGCLLNNERQGTWYSFSPQAVGTLGMLITPVDEDGVPNEVDYDFALWGPMAAITCPPSGAPLRCSYAYPPDAGTWLTGLVTGNSDASESARGTAVNGYVAPITIGTAQLGMHYVLYVDNFTANGQNFNLTWALSDNSIFDCSILPVQLVHLEAIASRNSVEVAWTTQTENGSSHYLVERSGDGETFHVIGSVDAAGYSQGNIDYRFMDERPINGWNYYRLTKVDLDGATEKTEVVTAIFRSTVRSLVLYPNPATDVVQMDLGEVEGDIAMILLMDASGRIVAQRTASELDNSGNISLHVQSVDAGSYMVSVLDVNGLPLANGRFIKQ